MNDNKPPVDGDNSKKPVLSFADYKNNKGKEPVASGATDKPPAESKPRSFNIELLGDVKLTAKGFLGVTPHFVAVADVHGNIDFVSPMERIYYVQVNDPEAQS